MIRLTGFGGSKVSLSMKGIVLVVLWLLCYVCAWGQIYKEPSLGPTELSALQPSFGEFLKQNQISAAEYDLCLLIADDSVDRAVQLEACRTLLKRQDIPFLLLRWATMMRVVLAGRLNQAEEKLSVARAWLATYPDQESLVPEEWLRRRREQFDVNLCLRCNVAGGYCYGASEAWGTGEHRFKVFWEMMAPLMEEKAFYSMEEIEAKAWFAERIVEMTGKYIISDTRRLENEKAFERLAAFRKQAPYLELRAAEQRAEQYRQIVQGLERALADPETNVTMRQPISPATAAEWVPRFKKYAEGADGCARHIRKQLESAQREKTPSTVAEEVWEHLLNAGSE